MTHQNEILNSIKFSDPDENPFGNIEHESEQKISPEYYETIRNGFAQAALQGLLTHNFATISASILSAGHWRNEDEKQIKVKDGIAQICFSMADAMMKAGGYVQ